MITTAHPRITDLRGCFCSVVQELALCQGACRQKVTPVLKNNGKIFQTKFFQKEVTKALCACNAKTDRCRSEALEEWFGWESRRDAQKKLVKKKEKGTYVKRSQQQICEIARKIQDAYYTDGERRNITEAPTKQQIRA